MLKIHPDAELAPRDIVARGVFAELAAGRGAFLDARKAIGDTSRSAFPACTGIARAPGSIRRATSSRSRRLRTTTWAASLTDARGRTSLDGLWAAGEVASTGAHGANRLASNSLLEAVVYAARIAEDIGNAPLPDAARPASPPRSISRPRLRSGARAQAAPDHVGACRRHPRSRWAARCADRDRPHRTRERAPAADAQHGNRRAAGDGGCAEARGKPRRTFPRRTSRTRPRASEAHLHHAGRRARDCGIAIHARERAVA